MTTETGADKPEAAAAAQPSPLPEFPAPSQPNSGTVTTELAFAKPLSAPPNLSRPLTQEEFPMLSALAGFGNSPPPGITRNRNPSEPDVESPTPAVAFKTHPLSP